MPIASNAKSVNVNLMNLIPTFHTKEECTVNNTMKTCFCLFVLLGMTFLIDLVNKSSEKPITDGKISHAFGRVFHARHLRVRPIIGPD